MKKKKYENKDNSIDRRGVGIANATSENYGIEGEGRTDTGNIQKTDTLGANVIHIYGDTPVGKLLSRLELLDKAFYGYVHGHQSRLKARYEESIDLEASFTEELQAIKQGLLDLAQVETKDDIPE